MSYSYKVIISILYVILLSGVCSMKAQQTEVIVEGIRSSEGRIVIGIYIDEQSFKEEKPFERKKFEKTKMRNGKMMVKIDLNPGIYGFALLDDENDDDEMNYNLIGIPKEGFGFSNYYLSGLSRPKFDSFSFNLKENQKLKINCKMRYM